MTSSDGRRDQAAIIPIAEVAQRLGISGLRPAGQEKVGPCPVCGGRDRFGINPARGLWNCRVCDSGGDGLALAQFVLACDFQGALDFLVGKADVRPDPAELERRRKQAEAAEAKQREVEEKLRARAIRDAREIWNAAEGHDVAPAMAYLAGRGITFAKWPPTLRYLPDHPYTKHWPDRGVVEWMRGPCMIAAVQNAEGRVTAVHQTWIDPDRPGQKARIIAPDGSETDAKGKPWPAKLVRGSKKGGAIRLTAQDPGGCMVMGEGIETTASAMVSGAWPGATFWSGVDLGNMAGRQEKIPGTRHSGRPDMTDADAFRPPEWVGRLVLLQDGDSDPKATRAKLEAGAKRAMIARPGLTAEIVAADPGRDFNDELQD